MTTSNFCTAAADYGGGLFQLINQKGFQGSSYLFSDIIRIVEEEIDMPETAEAEQLDWIQPITEDDNENINEVITETELMNLLIQASKEPENFFQSKNAENNYLIREKDLNKFLEHSGLKITAERITESPIIQIIIEPDIKDELKNEDSVTAFSLRLSRQISSGEELHFVKNESFPINSTRLSKYLNSQLTEDNIPETSAQIKITLADEKIVQVKSDNVNPAVQVNYSPPIMFDTKIQSGTEINKSNGNIRVNEDQTGNKVINLNPIHDDKIEQKISIENSKINIPITPEIDGSDQKKSFDAVKILNSNKVDNPNSSISNPQINEIKIPETPGNLIYPAKFGNENKAEVSVENLSAKDIIKLKLPENQNSNPPDLLFQRDNETKVKENAEPFNQLVKQLSSQTENQKNLSVKNADFQLQLGGENFTEEKNIRLFDLELKNQSSFQTQNQRTDSGESDHSFIQSDEKLFKITIDKTVRINNTDQNQFAKFNEHDVRPLNDEIIHKEKRQADDVKISAAVIEKNNEKYINQTENKDTSINSKSYDEMPLRSGEHDSNPSDPHDADKKSSKDIITAAASNKNHQSAEFKIEGTSLNQQIHNRESVFQAKEYQQEAKIIHASDLAEEIKSFVIKNDKSSITLKLAPEHLGTVKLSIDIHESAVTAKIEVENESVQRFVNSNMEQLRQSLNQSGLQLTSFSVTLSGGENKQPNRPESRKKYHSNEIEAKREMKAETINIRNMGYNTYEFLA